MNGKLSQRNHRLSDPLVVKGIGFNKSGYIFGAPEIDMGKPMEPQTFGIVRSHKAHLVEMKKEVFDKIWAHAKTFEN